MSVQASVVLNTARTLLNDDGSTLWTDVVLFPKLAQAHRELQTKLRFSAAPVMRAISVDIAVTTGAVTITNPADMMEPIRLWERAGSGGTVADYATGLMTESDPLPDRAALATLVNWQWSVASPEVINFVAASADRKVKLLYWRSLAIPTLNTDAIGFINGELYLAPRIAAIAASSVGNAAVAGWASGLADGSLGEVILSNRGRLKPADGNTARP
jgi:hypothetical protein